MKKNEIYLSPRQGEFVFIIETLGVAQGCHVPARWADIFIARRRNMGLTHIYS